jgi:hypothetical protein
MCAAPNLFDEFQAITDLALPREGSSGIEAARRLSGASSGRYSQTQLESI